MLSRFLILKVDNRSIGFATTYTEIQTAISELPIDDVDSMIVERLYSIGTYTPPADVTVECARDWAKKLGPADPVPAFVRHHCPAMRAEFAA